MNINIPLEARDEFWIEPPSGHMEFWAFRFRPPCKEGDELIFRFDKKPVARAIVYKIEKPGLTTCEHSGRYKNLWKVFWENESFGKIGDVNGNH